MPTLLNCRYQYPQTNLRRFRSKSGFTLIEVLITIVVLSVGLLGVAWLEFYSLRFNDNAHQQSMATILAKDMTERMRANPALFEEDDSDIPYTFYYNDSDWDTLDDSEPTNCSTASADCGPQTLAHRDIWEWQTEVQEKLPNATAMVCLDDKPDERADSDAYDEERGPDALANDCSLNQHYCDANGSAYVVKIWWCSQDTEVGKGGEAIDVEGQHFLGMPFFF